MRILALPIVLLSLSLSAFSQDPQDMEVRSSYRQECLEVAQYSIGKLMDVKCFHNYHHYNTAAKKYYNKDKVIKDGEVKIAEFNVLHPGMSKTRYKDYKKMAQLINRWDVVGVTELLPLLADDLKHNLDLLKFIKNTPEEITKLKEELSKLESKLTTASQKSIISIKTKMEEIKTEIESLEVDLKRAPSLYRDPGYVSILKELHNLKDGKEWSLILSPRGQASKPTDVQELAGYFYRGSKVRPKINTYCKEIRTLGKGTPIACIPNMGAEMLGVSKKDIFSRRPFLAEFSSGNFNFILLVSHVVYNSPTDNESMENILMKSFGVKHYEELGVGANAQNYARFAEVKVILEFMEQLRKRYSQKDVILLGDLNLESDNQFWSQVLNSMPGAEVYVKDKTSLSEARYNKDKTETNGLANDFDHFLFDPKETTECLDQYGVANAKVENFFEGITGRFINDIYNVRLDYKVGNLYAKNEEKYNKLVNEFITPLKNKTILNETFGVKLLKVGKKTIRTKGIIEDEEKTSKYIEGFYERLLDSQLEDNTYYSFFKQLLSDHMPISMGCSTK